MARRARAMRGPPPFWARISFAILPAGMADGSRRRSTSTCGAAAGWSRRCSTANGAQVPSACGCSASIRSPRRRRPRPSTWPGEGSLLSFITAPGQFYVNPETAARLSAAKTPPLVLSEKIPPGIAITDIGVAQQLLGAEGQISRLLLAPEQPLSRAPLEIVAPGLVERQPATAADLSRLTDSFHLNLTAFAVLAFAVGLFIVHAAIGLAFEQRRPVFRTLRALGVSARALVAAAGRRAAGLRAHRRAGGRGIGLGARGLLLPDVAATLRGLYGAEVPGTLTLRPAAWAGALSPSPCSARFGSAARELLAGSGNCRCWRLRSRRPGCGRARHRPGCKPSRPLVAPCGGRSDLALRRGPRRRALRCWPACFWLPR